MNYIEFCDRAVEYINDVVGNDTKVMITSMKKNNGLILDGMIIRNDNSRVSPTIYLNSYYEMYDEGMPFTDVMDLILSIYNENKNKHIDMDFFSDFSRVRDRIAMKLIHREMNDVLLNEVPYKPWNDLAIVFYYVLENDDFGTASILIRNEHIAMWKVDLDEIYDCAAVNTPRLLPDVLSTMSEIMRDMVKQSGNSTVNADDSDFDAASNMYVLSNTNKAYGATAILYTNKLRRLANTHNCGLYILPSSIHEVIILPSNECNNETYMRQMIKDVNEYEVSIEEKLSDNLYYYDPECERVRIVAV